MRKILMIVVLAVLISDMAACSWGVTPEILAKQESIRNSRNLEIKNFCAKTPSDNICMHQESSE